MASRAAALLDRKIPRPAGHFLALPRRRYGQVSPVLRRSNMFPCEFLAPNSQGMRLRRVWGASVTHPARLETQVGAGLIVGGILGSAALYNTAESRIRDNLVVGPNDRHDDVERWDRWAKGGATEEERKKKCAARRRPWGLIFRFVGRIWGQGLIARRGWDAMACSCFCSPRSLRA